MANRINSAFDAIVAEQELKQSTMNFLEKKTGSRKRFKIRWVAVAAAALVVIVFAVFFSYNLYHAETAVLDIDVNPSIEITLNRFGRVIAANAYNEEGEQLLESVPLLNKTYEEALEILIDKMVQRGDIQDAGLFSATLQTDDGALLNKVTRCIGAALKTHDKDIKQSIFAVDKETKTRSHDLNLSPAKYLVIMELQSLDPTVTVDSCRDSSISEINRKIENCRNEHGENKGDDHNPGEGNGDDHYNTDGGHNDDHNHDDPGNGHNRGHIQ